MTESSNNKSSSHSESKTAFIDDDRNTKLHYAAALGKTEDVLQEIQNGHKVDIVNYLGWTPLMMAARNGHIDIVKILLEHFADSTRRNKFGCSIFHVAIASGKLDLVVLVLQHLLCGGVTRKSMEGSISPISIAVLFNHMHIIQYLLDQSININSATIKTGITAVMFAVAMENFEIFNYLLSRGAETDQNSSGHKVAEILKIKQKHYNDCPMNLPNHVPSPILIVQPSFQQVVNPQHLIPVPSPTSYHPQMLRLPRKCSDIETPLLMSPAVISPITPTTVNSLSPATNISHTYAPAFSTQQLFFPPDFSPAHFTSPFHNISYNNDFLNTRLHQTTFLYTFPQFSPINGNQY